ncbi:MAG TPA: hypothetical protein VMS30_10185 [Phycisphaerales bacterium]|nr:hypothetical protein [Phycisphaerales bacterium]
MPPASKNPDSLRTLAQACVLTGDPARAAQVWKQAIAPWPDDQARAVMYRRPRRPGQR